MRRIRAAFLVVLAVAIAALALGCGSGDSTTETTATKAAAEAPPPDPPEPLDGLAERLEAEGLTPVEAEPGDATDALMVGGIEVVYYADPREAAVTGAEIGKIMANRPNNGLARRFGRIVVWTANQNGLTAKERERFAAVTRVVAQGG